VPVNVIYTDIRDEDYAELIRLACEANLSMLRVWGGGIYEPELFFRLCDENGIMVWQDFMFACGIYPRDDAFHANVYAEAVEILRKYRNFTSLVLWCGDNECDEAYTWAGRSTGYRQERLNRVTLKSAWERHDPHRPYIPSSSHSPFESLEGGDNPKSPFQGDSHMYIVSVDPAAKNYYRAIREHRPRFMSEYGFLSLPEKDTYYRFNFLRRTPERLLEHGKNIIGADVSAPEGGDHDELVLFSQLYYYSAAFSYRRLSFFLLR
jgi:beta-mannosidase